MNQMSPIVRQRLVNQQIAGTRFSTPADIVAWMVAMQAQEYAQAKWAVGLRLPGVQDSEVEKALSEGSILRTHLLRPTWHFVAAQDIRWLLMLTGPRVAAVNGTMYRKTELDSALFKRSHDIITKALEGGKCLTRNDLKEILEQQDIMADGFRLSYLMMQAEIDGIICSGPRQGKQFTYGLIEERVPAARKFTRAEALAELSERYFASRGPATAQDFATWSGLTLKDAKEGIGGLPASFVHESIEGQEYVFKAETGSQKLSHLQSTFLMPDYDEYGMGYKDRSAILGVKNPRTNPQLKHSLVIDGMIAGSWSRSGKNYERAEISTYVTPDEERQKAIDDAAKRYEFFMRDSSG